MKEQILKIAKDLEQGTINETEAQNLLLNLFDVSGSFVSYDEMEEFGRNAFYKGREVSRYDERGNVIFKRPTYNGYLRELDVK